MPDDEEDELAPDHVPGPGADVHDDEATEPLEGETVEPEPPEEGTP